MDAFEIQSNLHVEGIITSNSVIEALNTKIYQDTGTGGEVVINITGSVNLNEGQDTITNYEQLHGIPIAVRKSGDIGTHGTLTLQVNSLLAVKCHWNGLDDTLTDVMPVDIIEDGDVFYACYDNGMFVVSGECFTNRKIKIVSEDTTNIDGRIGDLKEYADKQDAAVLESAQTVASEKAVAARDFALKAANEYTDSALDEAKSYTDTASNNMKDYTDAAIEEGLDTKLSLSGGSMTGKLNALPSDSRNAGLNLGTGDAPVQPDDGDVWITQTGMYARIKGETKDLLAGRGNSGYGGNSVIQIPAVKFKQPETYCETVAHAVLNRVDMTAIALDNDTVLLVGGLDRYNQIDGNVIKLDLSSWRLEKLQAMPTPRTNAGVANDTEAKKVYVIGGRDSKGLVVGDIEVYDIVTNSWTTLPGLSTPREGCRAVVHGGKLYCIGGRNTDTVEVYNIALKTWSMLSKMAVPRFLFGSTSYHNYIMCMGGETAKGMSRTSDLYYPTTNSWAANVSMKESRAKFDIAMYSGVQCCLGDWDGQAFLYMPVNDKSIAYKRINIGAGASAVTTDDGVLTFGGRKPDGSVKAPVTKLVPGRMILSPVDEGDMVWCTGTLYTDTQRLKPHIKNRVNHEGMLYTDTDHEFGWIKKGGN